LTVYYALNAEWYACSYDVLLYFILLWQGFRLSCGSRHTFWILQTEWEMVARRSRHERVCMTIRLRLSLRWIYSPTVIRLCRPHLTREIWRVSIVSFFFFLNHVRNYPFTQEVFIHSPVLLGIFTKII
jgi:hypothetical protein